MPSVIKAALPFLGLLGAAVLVTGGAVLLARGGESPVATPEAGQAAQTASSIPPIDAAAPAGVETATFALG